MKLQHNLAQSSYILVETLVSMLAKSVSTKQMMRDERVKCELQFKLVFRTPVFQNSKHTWGDVGEYAGEVGEY
jgi:hypothetical protein